MSQPSDKITAQKANAQRRLYILHLLHSRPHTEAELCTALLDADMLAAESHDPAAAMESYHTKFRRDLDTLRAIGCDIYCDRRNSAYKWRNSPFGLSLDPTHLNTFAIILDTFATATIPHAGDIRALLNRLLNLLPLAQQRQITGQRRTFTISLAELSSYTDTDPHNISHIERAIAQGLRLQFTYRAARDGQQRQHEVEPIKLEYRNGHVYLYGWHVRRSKELPYRLDNILPGSAKLGNILAQHRHTSPSVTIRYHLSPTIARNPISQHFTNPQVEYCSDGSAIVTAQTNDLFEARRILLSYGEQAVALAPDYFVKELENTVELMCRNYHNSDK